MPTLQTIATYGTFVFMGLTAVAVWYNGKREVKSGDIADADKTVRLYKEQADLLERKVNELNVDLIRLQEQVKAKDVIIKDYLAILQGRNPELDNFMKITSASILLVERSLEAILNKLQIESVK